MTTTFEKERTLQRQIGMEVESALPGVEVLAVELSSPHRFTVFIDHPEGVDHALCGRVTDVLRDYLRDYGVDVSSPGLERPLRKPEHFRSAVGREVAVRPLGSKRLRGEVVERRGAHRHHPDRRRRRRDPVRPDRAGEPDLQRSSKLGPEAPMSQEIIEAVRTIEREKGIEPDALVSALEDALLAAYKKTPGAARHAVVELDDEGEFRVFSIEIPSDLEARLLDEACEAQDRRARAARGGDGRAAAHAHRRRRPRPRLVSGARGPDPARRRHAGELRPHRRADGEAGDPAADPRGRAGDDVRRVHRPLRARSSPASSSRRATATTSSSTSARSRRCCRAPSRSTASATSRARASRP